MLSRLGSKSKFVVVMALVSMFWGATCELTSKDLASFEMPPDAIARGLAAELDNARTLGFVEAQRMRVNASSVERLELAFGECAQVIVAPGATAYSRSLRLFEQFDPSTSDESAALVRAESSRPTVLSAQYCAGFGGPLWAQLTAGEISRAGQLELVVLRRSREGFDVERLNRGERTAYGTLREQQNELRYRVSKDKVAQWASAADAPQPVLVEPMRVAILPASSELAANAAMHARLGVRTNALRRDTGAGAPSSLVALAEPPLAWADDKWWRIVAIVDASASPGAFEVRLDRLGSTPSAGVHLLSDRRWSALPLTSQDGVLVDDFASNDELRVYVADFADENPYAVRIVESQREKSAPVVGERNDLSRMVAYEVRRESEECDAGSESACIALIEYERAGFRMAGDAYALARKMCIEQRTMTVCRALARRMLESRVDLSFSKVAEISCAVGDAEVCRELARRARIGERGTQDLALAQSFYDQSCRLGEPIACADAETLRALRGD